MFEADALIHYDNRLFFAQTLARGQETDEIAPEKVEDIHQDIAALAHKLITIKEEDLSSESGIRERIQEAFLLTSLGLEYGSQGDLDKSTRLLSKNRVIKFFQIGNTLLNQLVERSQNTLGNAVLISPETPMQPLIGREEIPVYNGWEREFLELVFERKLVIDAAQVVLHQVSPPRPLTRLADIAVANQQLDYLDYRLNYLQALPQEKIFDAEYQPRIDGDTAQQLTTALMVNLILYREIDFHLDPNDLDNFRDIAYDAEHGIIKKASQDQLLGWIGHYLDLAQQRVEIKKYAIEYWRDCLRQLEAELRREDALEAVNVLRT